MPSQGHEGLSWEALMIVELMLLCRQQGPQREAAGRI